MKKIFYILQLVLLLFFTSSQKWIDSDKNDETLESPISLTSSDGQGLEFTSYESNTVLEGFISFTEIKLSFRNTENRQREGKFKIQLPDNAHIARFAMQIDNRWQEGEVVEKEKARRAYEDFLHRRQDPALLEQEQGNEFSARIFPIPANGTKNLILSYSVPLGGVPPKFKIPLNGLPQIKNFKLTVQYNEEEFKSSDSKNTNFSEGETSSKKVFAINKSNYQPKKDFLFEHKQKSNFTIQNGKYFGLYLVPITESKTVSYHSKDTVVLIDTSASSTLNYKNNLEDLEKVLKDLKSESIHYFMFDQDVSYLGEKLKPAFDKLEKVEPLGATDITKAIQGISKEIDISKARLIIVSDGASTFGNTDKKEISKLVKKTGWIERIDFIIPNSYRDLSTIDELIVSGKISGTKINLSEESNIILKKLNSKVFMNNTIKVENAKWIYPEKIESIQNEEPILVFGELKEEEKLSKEDISFNGKNVSELQSFPASLLLLEREVIASRINKLLEISENDSNDDVRNGMKLQAIELSIKNRIVIPFTSMIVLETEADYDRFGITRNSLANILTIGINGLDIINRKNSEFYSFLNDANVARRTEENEKPNPDLPKRKKSKNGHSSSVANKPASPSGGASNESSAPVFNEKEEERSADKKELAKDSKMDKTSSASGVADEDDVISSKTSTSPINDEPTREVVPTNPDKVTNVATKPERLNKEYVRRPPRPYPIQSEPQETREKVEPLSGNFKKVKDLLEKGEFKNAYKLALKWRTEHPDDTLALIALGDSAYRLNDKITALRAYSSLIDYFPSRADIRRFAGEKLLAIGEEKLAIDTLSKALEQRPDHPSTYHLLAMAYLMNEDLSNAARVLAKGINTNFDSRYSDVHQILYDDLDLVYSIAIKTNHKDHQYLEKMKSEYKINSLSNEIKFILMWETDANDVDFHIYDKYKNHAFYSQKGLASGGELYADITQGYGPECFRIIDPNAFPYRLEAHYYSKGPMGYGMGAVQIIRYDGKEGFSIETRPYVIMTDGAFLNLGSVK